MAAAVRRRRTGIDRISPLPDHILHRILSPLPTLQVVRTCILSKRWRDLWASVPHLRFEWDDKELQKMDIQRFIGMVLVLRDDSHLQTFQLREIEAPAEFLDSWVLYAAIRQVQNLDLCSVSDYMDEALPLRVFGCQSLITLCLVGYICPEIVNSIHLGKLTKLELVDMKFEKDSLGKLISGCPAVQHLIIDECIFDSLDISSPQLKSLEFMDCNGYFDLDTVITISAPGLISFNLNIHSECNFILKNVTSLVSACIYLNPESLDSIMILDSLYTVRYLELQCDALEHVFGRIISLKQQPTFSNLKKLKVYAKLDDGPIQAITCLLQCAPNLEELVVISKIRYRAFSKSKWELRASPGSFLRKLRMVEIQRFERRPTEAAEQTFICFLLSNACALDRILLSHSHY